MQFRPDKTQAVAAGVLHSPCGPTSPNPAEMIPGTV